MPGAPDPAAHGFDPRALAAAGWTEADLAWEGLQERAAEANAAGEATAAAHAWAEALKLARAHFAPNDPRLAASLANQALALTRAGKAETARSLLDEALLVWDSSGPWIEALKSDRRARSSLFHLRMERKHRGGYDRFWRERYAALAAEGRSALRAQSAAVGDAAGTAGAGTAGEDRLARWRRERPEGFGDARKLMAAALLIAPPEPG